MKVKRKIVEIDEERCTGCGECVPACAEGAIEIVDGKARVVEDKYCDGLGACLGNCPVDALKISEREAEEFDPEAVEHYLAEKEQAEKTSKEPALHKPSGCPSSRLHVFKGSSCEDANEPRRQEDAASALSHWPVKIRLIPAKAPFLKGADIVVAADCTAVAYPNFNRDFLKDKVVLTGCPKFDDVQEYIDKFTDIFRTAGIRSVTVLDMEVPCCSAMPVIVRKGMEAAGKEVPLEEIVISIRGQVLKRGESAA